MRERERDSMKMIIVWEVGSINTDISFVFEYKVQKNQLSVKPEVSRPLWLRDIL